MTRQFHPRLLGCLLLLPLFWSTGYSQTGSIHGIVIDQRSGDRLVGANALLVETALGSVTDLDGNYTIRNIPPGTYSLRVSFVGYAPKLVTGIVVKERDLLKVNIDLVSQDVSTEEIVVTAERQLATEAAILAQRKRASTIGDGFSKEQVGQIPAATASDALRRVTGISVVDNKFVFVRGVTDRYNGTMINGVPVTSTDTEMDKRSFTYDIIPAGLLENTVVTKTATPDLPADFTGGLVQMNTMAFPERTLLKVGLGLGYNNISSLSTILRSQGGSSDWIGFDDGSRDFVGGTTDRYQLGQALPNTWAQRSARSPLNGLLEAAYGNTFALGNQQLGLLTSLAYRGEYARTEFQGPTFSNSPPLLDAKQDVYRVLWGGLLDLSAMFGTLHRVSMRNSFNQSAEDKLLNGLASNVGGDEREANTRITEWNQRSLYMGQLSGEHVVPSLAGVSLQWGLSYSSTRSEQPDRRLYIAERPTDPTVQMPWSMTISTRSWAKLYEDTRRGTVDVTLPLGSDVKMKLGGAAEWKRRDYSIRFFQAGLTTGSPNVQLLILPIDSIFRPENFAPGKFAMDEFSRPSDEYSGAHSIVAGYLMGDLPFAIFEEQFRLTGGARLEDSRQTVTTIDPRKLNTPYDAHVDNVDVLPSVNLTYQPNVLTNIRLAYSQTVNRPEFRELANFFFFDYFTFEGTYGNPYLRRALSRNYDVRAELFPDTGEVISVGYFYKNITDAIEVTVIPGANPERTWFNSARTHNYGWEVELRKSLGFLSSYMGNVMISGNYTRVVSAVEYVEGYKVDLGGGVYENASRTRTREMQGQSPYMINLGLFFHEPTLGTNISILYNAFGRRLDAVGDYRSEDIFEEPAERVDLTVVQPVMSSLQLKLSVGNLTREHSELTTRQGDLYRRTYKGVSYGFKASYTL